MRQVRAGKGKLVEVLDVRRGEPARETGREQAAARRVGAVDACVALDHREAHLCERAVLLHLDARHADVVAPANEGLGLDGARDQGVRAVVELLAGGTDHEIGAAADVQRRRLGRVERQLGSVGQTSCLVDDVDGFVRVESLYDPADA